MTINWIVDYLFTGLPTEQFLADIEREFTTSGYVVAVAADPPSGQWSLSVGPDASTVGEALSAARLLLVQFLPEQSAIAVDVLTVEELARRAELPTIPTLLGLSEVARVLGVSRQRVHQLRRENINFPAPLIEVAMGPLWDADVVREFDRRWPRRSGRPID